MGTNTLKPKGSSPMASRSCSSCVMVRYPAGSRPNPPAALTPRANAGTVMPPAIGAPTTGRRSPASTVLMRPSVSTR
ncbi:Uncharacterised protein [Mycobacteroides abscessus subsp. abscessus]|nr:Uncharacterised protein [Mycobacteroides abscessus subsp. abscessus]